VTIDEELELLHEQLRRLKIEYDIFFNNPTKRPPTDIEWKVVSLIRKFSDGRYMSFAQRFKYNEMAQRYAVQSDLWRKKMRIRDEGHRKPYDAMLTVAGARVPETREAAQHRVYGLVRKDQVDAGTPHGAQLFSVQCSGATPDQAQIESLYQALREAKQKLGEQVSGSLDSFTSFLRKKTGEIRQEYGCETVLYSVELEDGQVKLKAKAKV